MEFDLFQGSVETDTFACVKKGSFFIGNVADAGDLMFTVSSVHGALGIIIYKEDICDDFFDLSTKLAGDILQKYTTYRMRIAIVGDFKESGSQSLRDFIYESNKGRQVCFASSLEEAKAWMAGK